MYHAGWAWAGSTPYKSTKLVGAYLGRIRQPLAVSWPKGIKPDKAPRPQSDYAIDIVPTIYEVTKNITKEKLQFGKMKLEVIAQLTSKVSGPMDVILKVNGNEVAAGKVPVTAAFHFIGNDCLDLGRDL